MTEYLQKEEGYLTGQLLIAMPNIGDPRFNRSVIYLCAHSADGAMGLVINKPADEIGFDELLSQLGVLGEETHDKVEVYAGGPVETGRGFVLHTDDYCQDSTLLVADGLGLTATIDILRAIASGNGPSQCLLALGYAGWSAGQLENELQTNGWLSVDADPMILFESKSDAKWGQAIAKVGVDVSFLSNDSGRA